MIHSVYNHTTCWFTEMVLISFRRRTRIAYVSGRSHSFPVARSVILAEMYPICFFVSNVASHKNFNCFRPSKMNRATARAVYWLMRDYTYRRTRKTYRHPSIRINNLKVLISWTLGDFAPLMWTIVKLWGFSPLSAFWLSPTKYGLWLDIPSLQKKLCIILATLISQRLVIWKSSLIVR